MQKPKLQLEEIIYEITGACDGGCDYCGSKESWTNAIDNETIKKIVEEIKKFPPKKLHVSGGNPILVDLDTHSELTRIMHTKDVYCTIIVNPKNVDAQTGKSVNILNLYDWIGVSINNEKELELAIRHQIFAANAYKTTIITNFNATNVFDFDKIHEFVKGRLIWQIQFTLYHDRNDSRAIYNNDAALQYLKDKIKTAMLSTDIIIADPANSGKCTAGASSIGILCDGSVVPCLSMRSWKNDMNAITEGKLLKQSLEDIWRNSFHTQRYCEFECCKDVCKNKKLDDIEMDSLLNKKIRTDKELQEMIDKLKDNFKPAPSIYPYEHPHKPIIMVYGVGNPPITAAYAVYGPDWHGYNQKPGFCGDVPPHENT